MIVKVLYRNRGKGATWTTNGSVATLPACHLGLENRQRAWRSTDATAGRWLKLDVGTTSALGSSYDLDGLALVSGNLTTNALVVVEAASCGDLLTTTTATSTGASFGTTLTPWAAPRTGVVVAFFAARQGYRYWRLLLTDSGNADGYLQLGVAALGPVASMAAAPETMHYALVDPSVTEWAPSGTPATYALPAYATVELPHRFLAESLVFGDLQDVGRTLRQADGVLSLYSSDPSGSTAALATNLYGRLVADVAADYAEVPALYHGALAFRESL